MPLLGRLTKRLSCRHSRALAGRKRHILIALLALLALRGLLQQLRGGQDVPAGRGAVGELAPDLVLQPLAPQSGPEQSLYAWRGRWVILDFWATWCVPCRRSLPQLAALAARYGSAKVALLSVHVGLQAPAATSTEQAAVEAARTQAAAAQAPVYFDRAAGQRIPLSHAFAVEAIPTTVLIDPNGRIHQRTMGQLAPLAAALAAALK